MKPKTTPAQRPPRPDPSPPPPEPPPEFDGTDFGVVVARSKNRAQWQLTRISRGPDGEMQLASLGPLPRARFLVELVRAMDELKRYAYDGSGL